jgi:acylphosphatase
LQLLVTRHASRVMYFCYNLLMKTFHYLISGQVQGVAFRHYTVREAERLGISGTVRNLPDDRVEVFAQGDEAQISQFESFLHIGPRAAAVERVEREVVEQDEVFRGFDITW